MSVNQPNVVDIISTDKLGTTILTISDHLDWVETTEHLLLLQAKINAYLSFIEGGEIYQKRPEAQGHPIVIAVVFRHLPNVAAQSFLEEAKVTVDGAGFGFRFDQIPAMSISN